MKILVTGATGFVGNHIVNWFVKNNFDVIATSTSEEKAKKFDWYNNVTYIPCNYFSENLDFYEHFSFPDIIIHAAWKGLPNYMDQIHIDNLIATSKLLNSFIQHKKTKIVCIGTDKEYGKVEGLLSEDKITNPNTVYGLAKDTLRKNLEFQVSQLGINWNWIRLFFIYGNGQSQKSLLPQLETAIRNGDKIFPMSPGDQLRDYLPVEKAAEYICKISLSKTNGIINCCSGKPISVKSLVEKRIKELNAEIELKCGAFGYSPVEGMNFWGDNTKLQEIVK